ncbi:MAG: redoxin family protein [Armatimonadota bacterium]|nr:redoxin family protein [Armatimonadota bacterium]
MIVALLAAVAFNPIDGLAVGDRVAFTANTLSGASIASSKLTGRPTVLVLWGPWSHGSSRALVDLTNLSRTDKRARFVGLASWDEPANVKGFLATVSGVDLEMWVDPAQKNVSDSIAVKVFKTRRFPSVYVLDSTQQVVGSFLGYKSTDDVAALITKAIGRED